MCQEGSPWCQSKVLASSILVLSLGLDKSTEGCLQWETLLSYLPTDRKGISLEKFTEFIEGIQRTLPFWGKISLNWALLGWEESSPYFFMPSWLIFDPACSSSRARYLCVMWQCTWKRGHSFPWLPWCFFQFQPFISVYLNPNIICLENYQ